METIQEENSLYYNTGTKFISCFELLEHSFVITIDDNRLREFRRRFLEYGLFPEPKALNGIKYSEENPNTEANCGFAHKKAILKAKELNWPYVGIFEDDAYPCINVTVELSKYLSHIPSDCNCLMFGYLCEPWCKDGPKDFIKGQPSWGAHSYLVFKEAYDKYAEYIDKNPQGDGPMYGEFNDILPRDTFYQTYKPLFIQHTNYGSIHHVEGDYTYNTTKGQASINELNELGFRI